MIRWIRDDVELFRVVADVPEGADQMTARLDTICNEANWERSGHLSFGNQSVGIINWNTCLLYPEGAATADIRVRLRLRLPEGWKYASASRPRGGEEGKPGGRHDSSR